MYEESGEGGRLRAQLNESEKRRSRIEGQKMEDRGEIA